MSCLTFGCTDSEACNYDAEATFEDGSCTYAAFPYDCEGNCVNDNDEDGICDEFEVFGCTDSAACNYSEGATDDDDSCTYDCYGCTNPAACNFDEEALLDDGSCDFTSCIVVGCTDPMACNYDTNAEYDNGTCTYIQEGACDCEGNVEDALGECGGTCGADDNQNGVCDDAEIYGCTSEFACNYDMTATVDDGSCDFISCLTFGCTDPTACNYDDEAQFDDGSCTYAAFPYDCEGACVNDADGDGVCDELEMPGCTDTEACNYNPEATDDADICVYPDAFLDSEGNCLNDLDGDGICDEFEMAGCTDFNACNYDNAATDDDGSCQYTDACGVCGGPGAIYECGCLDIPEGDCDCDGNQLDALGVCGGDCAADDNGNGVCDDAEILGCTISIACNYDPSATQDDGSCDFTSCLPFGCTDADACNYDAEALYDDGTCEYASFPYDCDGNCVNDADGDGVCDEFEIPGCTDEEACNYNPEATDDGGNCTYPDDLYDCDGNCLNDADGNELCDELESLVAPITMHATLIHLPLKTTTAVCMDECGVCGGPGAIYECGCSDIPTGDCDCDGNRLDALACVVVTVQRTPMPMASVTTWTTVWRVRRVRHLSSRAIYECGCSDIPEGDCDCGGNQLDALGVWRRCGG